MGGNQKNKLLVMKRTQMMRKWCRMINHNWQDILDSH